MVEAVEVYELWKSTWDYDEYSASKESLIKRFKTKQEVQKEKKRLERKYALEKKRGTAYDDIFYYIKTKLVRPCECKNYEKRPEFFKHIEEVQPIPDTCGAIRELYASNNISLAYVNLSGQAKKHKHHVMEEIYYVTKGKGYLTLEDKIYRIEEGDSINIPKDKWHFLKTDKDSELELLVVTSPRFMPEDVIL